MSLRAFDLVPVLERAEFRIESFEATGNDLYLGSDDCTIIHYEVEEKIDDITSKVIYSIKKVAQRTLNNKRPIIQLKTASALDRLMVLNDGNIFLLESEKLNSIGSAPKLKNVLAFCVNENPNTLDPFIVQFCVGKRRSIQVCALHEDRVTLSREISTSDATVNLAMDGVFVCAAGQNMYSVYNIENGSNQELIPYDPNRSYPHIKRIAKEEFLISGPGNLGVFVMAAGVSERPPIQWIDNILSLSYYHPYILTISSEFVRVYSLVDQQHKQTLNFSGGSLLGNFDGQLYIGTQKCVYCLMPQPWTTQVQTLLESERVEEAVELAEHSGAAGMTLDHYHLFMNTLLQKAGFIKLSQQFYSQAEDFFIRGKLDAREVISLFPGLLPTSTSFMRSQPPLHQMADIIQASHGNPQYVKDAKQFLIDYLLTIRSSRESNIHLLELDTAIIKLYAEKKSNDLVLFLESDDIQCDVSECSQNLELNEMYTALAKLYVKIGRIDSALNILLRLLKKEIMDDSFTGIDQLIDCLVNTCDANIIWKYADFVLETNSPTSIKIFTESSVELDPHKVLQKLHDYPDIRLSYLHYLIHEKNLQDEQYHTELIIHYVSLATQKQSKDKENLLDDEIRNKLQSLLHSSKHYQPQLILTYLKDSSLYLEISIVYGRLGEHDKALSILVHEMKDFSAAEQYCIKQSQEVEGEMKFDVFLKLLKIYLRPPPGGAEDNIQLGAALELLAIHAEQLKLESVIEILPSHWSLSIAHHYLRAALRSSLHKSRLKSIEHKLIKSTNLQKKYIFNKLSSAMGPIPLSSNKLCSVCEKSFKTCKFVIYPNGVMTHPECAPNKHVCPLTGTVFKVTKGSSDNGMIR